MFISCSHVCSVSCNALNAKPITAPLLSDRSTCVLSRRKPLPKHRGASCTAHWHTARQLHNQPQRKRSVHSSAQSPASEAATSSTAGGEWVEVGILRAPHGVRGEIKVQPLTDFPEDRLAEPGARWLQQPDTAFSRRQKLEPVETELEWGRPSISKGNVVWLVKLACIDSPEEAEGYRNQRLLVRAADRPALKDEDEFYIQDLVGMRVLMHDSKVALGTVVDIYDGTGAHDVLRIRLDEPANQAEDQPKPPVRTTLIPFVKEMVPVVDRVRRVLEVSPPEGLIEATTSTAKLAKGRRDQPLRKHGKNAEATLRKQAAKSDAEKEDS